jgi:hypothetical protein
MVGKILFLLFAVCDLVACGALVDRVWGATYYMRHDGAATKANSAATAGGGCSAVSSSMSVATHNAATFSAGDTIYLCNDGGAYTAQIKPPSSGSSGSPITYTNPPGQATPTIFDQNNGGSNYCFWISEKSYLVVDGLTFQKPGSTTGTFVIQSTGAGSTNNIVKNCTITTNLNSGTALNVTGVNGNNNTAQNCIIASNAPTTVGSIVHFGTPSTTITGSTIISTESTKQSGNGIMIDYGHGSTVSYCTIGGSRENGMIIGISIEGGNNNIIEHNNISWCWGQLAYPSGARGYAIALKNTYASSGNITRYNFISYSERAYYDYSSNAVTAGNKVYYNIFYRNTVSGITLQNLSATYYAEAFNNTIIHHIARISDGMLVDNDIGHGIVVQNGGLKAKIYNNFIAVDQDISLVEGITLAGSFTDVYLGANHYQTTNGAALGNLKGTQYDTLEDWQTAIAGDSAVIEKDTGSQRTTTNTNLSPSGYSLVATSPAINAGYTVTGIHDQVTPATDYAGSSVTTIPDIGAYESGGTNLYFDTSAAAGGNGTSQLAYSGFSDYTFSGYNLRAGAYIYLKGSAAPPSKTALSDSSGYTATCWPGYSCTWTPTNAIPVQSDNKFTILRGR